MSTLSYKYPGQKRYSIKRNYRQAYGLGVLRPDVPQSGVTMNCGCADRANTFIYSPREYFCKHMLLDVFIHRHRNLVAKEAASGNHTNAMDARLHVLQHELSRLKGDIYHHALYGRQDCIKADSIKIAWLQDQFRLWARRCNRVQNNLTPTKTVKHDHTRVCNLSKEAAA